MLAIRRLLHPVVKWNFRVNTQVQELFDYLNSESKKPLFLTLRRAGQESLDS